MEHHVFLLGVDVGLHLHCNMPWQHGQQQTLLEGADMQLVSLTSVAVWFLFLKQHTVGNDQCFRRLPNAHLFDWKYQNIQIISYSSKAERLGGKQHSFISFHFTKALVASALFKGLIHFLLTGTERSNGGFLRQQEVRQNMQFLILLIAKSPKQDDIVMTRI